MSLDYPFYERLRRRKHRAARYWMIGDRLYYPGLLLAYASVILTLVNLVRGLIGQGWGRFSSCAILFGGGLVIFFVGTQFKAHSYDLAERDGISTSIYPDPE